MQVAEQTSSWIKIVSKNKHEKYANSKLLKACLRQAMHLDQHLYKGVDKYISGCSGILCMIREEISN